MTRGRSHRAALVAAIMITACGGDGPTNPQPVPTPQPGIHTVAGAGVDDTVLSQPLQALIVEVRGTDGQLARGVRVRFDARPPADSARPLERAVYVCTLSSPACGPTLVPNGVGNDSQFASDTTDANGRAKALVRLGTVAGPARVAVSVPELGLIDSASFTVRAGAAATVRFATRDTMLYVGATAALGPAVRDRFGNPRNDAITVTPDGSGVVDADAKGVVTGRQAGRARILAQAGAAKDSAFVSVVPRGRLVAWAAYDGSGTMVLVDIDGSHLKRLTTNPSGNGAFPVWSPISDKILFHTGTPTVDLVDSAGAQRKTVGPSPSWFPQFLPDESGMLYVAPGTGGTSAWRARLDGSQPVELATLTGFQGYPYGGASFSPAGDRVAYTNSSAITIVDLTTGRAVRDLPFGDAPRWSPAGDRVAFTTGFDGGIGVVNADGTGRRTLTTTDAYSPGVSWSPDGQWLIARRSTYPSGLTLVRASDGLTIPLHLSLDLYQPAWR